MSLINVGAYVNGLRPNSKAALRRALTDGVSRVAFDVTSPLGPRPGATISATAEDIGDDRLCLVGPDPFTKRNFYGTVSIVKGEVKVS